MRDLKNDLLLKILNHKDWESQSDIIDLLKEKGAFIDENNQEGLILKKQDIFNKSLPFFKIEFSEDRFNPLNQFLYLHLNDREESMQKNNVIKNIATLVSLNNKYLYHRPSNKADQNGRVVKSNFEFMLEHDCSKIMIELINSGLVKRSDIDNNGIDLVKSLGFNFLHISFHKDPPSLIKSFLENGIVSRQELFEEFMRRAGTSDSIYNGARMMTDDRTLRTLERMLYGLQGDVFLLNKMGFMDLLKNDDEKTKEIIKTFNEKMDKLMGGMAKKRADMLRDLYQSNEIYVSAMKEYVSVLDPIKNLNNSKKNYGLKNVDFSLSTVQKEYSEVLNYLRVSGVRSRFSSDDDMKVLEQTIKLDLIEINKQNLDMHLSDGSESKTGPDKVKNKI